MDITPLRQLKNEFFMDCSSGDSDRKIGCYSLFNVTFCGRTLHYPNILFQTRDKLVSPYDERVMSLQCDSFYDKNIYTGSLSQAKSLYSSPVFFFALNVDNYFHFIYDTLPYLYYYLDLKKSIPDLSLLVQTSHPTKSTLPKFVLETFELLGIQEVVFLEESIEYSQVYFGLSLTHGGQSNTAPHPYAYSVWERLRLAAIEKVGSSLQSIDKFYVSRRSWLSKHPENIGTNYTTRRKCLNEDALVEYLATLGFQEIFCEDLTMAEKIFYFARAKDIVGIIGGGMCNCLFSPQFINVHCLITKGFFDINYRFGFSMQHTMPSYSFCCPLVPHEGKFSLYTRVKIDKPNEPYHGCIGEIESYQTDGLYTLKLAKEGVAGFSQDFTFETLQIHQDSLTALDPGLNSPYICDLERFKQSFRNSL